MTGFYLNRRQTLTGAGALTLAGCGKRRPDKRPEGLLRVGLSGEPDSLDPLQGQFAVSALIYKQIHAPLTDYSPSGGLAPGLADSWRSDNGRVWTFHLNSGLKWSDGAPLTADDVVWTARRAVDPTTGFADLGDFFAVEGAREALRGEASPEDIGVTATDALTVEFRFTQPVGLFPVFMREFYPLPRHAIEGVEGRWTRAENWVSAGPFILADQGPLSLRLARNPNYLGASTVRLPQVQLDVIEDAATRSRLFRAGDLDLVDQPPPEQIGLLRREVGDQVRAFQAPILRYLKVNHTREGLNDVRVRRAISRAIDRHFIADQFFHGESSPTERVIPGERAGFTNLAAAAHLLSTTGISPDNPLRLTLRCTTGGPERIAIAIADDLSRIGIELSLLATYPVDLFQAVDAGDFDIALSRFDRGLKADPNFMMEPFGPDGFADDNRWSGPERNRFDRLMNMARAEINTELRTELYRDAEEILLDQQAIIPLIHERAYWLVSDRVSGLRSDIQPMQWRDLALD